MNIDKKSRPIYKSLEENQYLTDDLISWLRNKQLSVRQAKDLLEFTKNIIDDAWRTEEYKVKI